MRYATAADFRMALESRLLARSRASATSIVRLRKAVVFDRLLARLGEVAAGRWVLKGALALDYRFQQRARTTMDLDLARHDDEAAATADLVGAQAIDLGDHFAFAAERTSRLDALQEARAVRFHVACELAGRPFDNVRLDIAFNPRPASETDLLLGPDLLAFADIPPVQVPVVPLDQHVAEKLHAYSRGYGKEGVESTRVKDLVDLILIADLAPIDAKRLRRALERTFRDRDQHPLPAPGPPSSWGPRYRKMAAEVGITLDLGEAYLAAARFLDPVLADQRVDSVWDPTHHDWLGETR